MFGSLFGQRQSAKAPTGEPQVGVGYDAAGYTFTLPGVKANAWMSNPQLPADPPDAGARLAMLVDEGHAFVEEACVRLPWAALYTLRRDPQFGAFLDDLGVHDERLGAAGGKGIVRGGVLAALGEGAGDVVGVVLDQGALDAVVDVADAEGDGVLALDGGPLLELFRDRAGDVLHELAVRVIVDVAFFLTSQEEVRQGTAHGVRDLGGVEITLCSTDVDLDRGAGFDLGLGQRTPFETRLLVLGGLGDLFEAVVFLEQVGDHSGRSGG